jgi:5-(carboxyamino)imidazole ribonucleotide synthase
MFVTKDGEILVNELAPRPHNSAHGTIESYNISQYQALIMAILDEDL